MRQIDVAQAVGVSATYLSRVERGEISATSTEIRLLGRVLPQLPQPAPHAVREPSARGRSRRAGVLGGTSVESL
jgi:transcriptional regulator with XRE-family HTH domain